MKELKDYRKLAILMDKTHFDIWEVCKFLNATYNFWYNNTTNIFDYGKFMKNQTGLTKKKIHLLNVAMTEMINEDEYSLAKEYAMISNVLVSMDEADFDQCNPEIYKETEKYFDELGTQILEECQNHYTNACKDIMYNGKIMSDQENVAIYRYMANAGFFSMKESDIAFN